MEYLTTLASVPAIIALVTLAKDLGLPTRWSPILSVLLGVALTLFSASALTSETPWQASVAMGIILGLSASGLYDGARAIGTKEGGDSA